MAKKKVLVPIDGSEFAQQIFPVILKFLDPNATELILLRVGQPVGGHVGTPPRPAAIEGAVMMYDTPQDAEQASHPIYASQERDSVLADFIAEIQDQVNSLEAAGFTVSSALRFGDRGEEIVNYVNGDHMVDMVAMTTHWRTGINRLLFGNTLQYITPRINVPLLVVRPTSDEL